MLLGKKQACEVICCWRTYNVRINPIVLVYLSFWYFNAMYGIILLLAEHDSECFLEWFPTCIGNACLPILWYSILNIVDKCCIRMWSLKHWHRRHYIASFLYFAILTNQFVVFGPLCFYGFSVWRTINEDERCHETHQVSETHVLVGFLFMVCLSTVLILWIGLHQFWAASKYLCVYQSIVEVQKQHDSKLHGVNNDNEMNHKHNTAVNAVSHTTDNTHSPYNDKHMITNHKHSAHRPSIVGGVAKDLQTMDVRDLRVNEHHNHNKMEDAAEHEDNANNFHHNRNRSRRDSHDLSRNQYKHVQSRTKSLSFDGYNSILFDQSVEADMFSLSSTSLHPSTNANLHSTVGHASLHPTPSPQNPRKRRADSIPSASASSLFSKLRRSSVEIVYEYDKRPRNWSKSKSKSKSSNSSSSSNGSNGSGPSTSTSASATASANADAGAGAGVKERHVDQNASADSNHSPSEAITAEAEEHKVNTVRGRHENGDAKRSQSNGNIIVKIVANQSFMLKRSRDSVEETADDDNKGDNNYEGGVQNAQPQGSNRHNHRMDNGNIANIANNRESVIDNNDEEDDEEADSNFEWIAKWPIIGHIIIKTSKYFDRLNENPSIADLCMICYDHFNFGDRVSKLNCKHTYHTDCLRLWFADNNYCPLCSVFDNNNNNRAINRAA